MLGSLETVLRRSQSPSFGIVYIGCVHLRAPLYVTDSYGDRDEVSTTRSQTPINSRWGEHANMASTQT